MKKIKNDIITTKKDLTQILPLIKKGNIVSFAMQKGGVGKTTTVRNIGSHLAEQGYTVLLVDLDPQGNLTTACSNQLIIAESEKPTVFDIFVNNANVEDTLVEIEDRLFLSPALLNLASVELSIAGEMAREMFLKSAIDEMEKEFDFILLDCPPSLNLLTVNALVASNHVVYVTQLDYFILQGLEQLRSTVSKARKLNPSLNELGIVETMDDNTNHTSDVSEAINQKQLVVLGTIDRATAVRDAIMYKQAIKDYEPNHKNVEQYNTVTMNLLKEIEKGL